MNEFDDLWERILSDQLSEEDQHRLRQLLQTQNQQIPDAIDKMLMDKDLKGLAPADREQVLLQRILSGHTAAETPLQSAIVRPFYRRRTWAAAAAILLLLAATTTILYLNHRKAAPAGTPASAIAKQDILPGHSGAILTLSNGKQIVLDSAGNGTLASDSHIKVIKKDGQLAYEGKTAEVLYNTVSTPKGRQWQLTLGDGTKVWLNAASSIHYPISFTGNERKIEVTGEAYLEVSPDAVSPFVVMTPTQRIQVLGTHFNVNAYADEPILRTTLLEGSIKVNATGKTILLHPGEQVANNPTTGDLATTKPDVSNVTAWINGRFKFDHSDIKTVMRQIARWYDVEVEYRGNLPDYQFAGGTFRNNNLSEVLQVLELSGLHFKLENHKIIVMQ
ncbi:MAG TPA: FecR domain-containing protein [Puia sp.]|jgi:hypothetical protein